MDLEQLRSTFKVAYRAILNDYYFNNDKVYNNAKLINSDFSRSSICFHNESLMSETMRAAVKDLKKNFSRLEANSYRNFDKHHKRISKFIDSQIDDIMKEFDKKVPKDIQWHHSSVISSGNLVKDFKIITDPDMMIDVITRNIYQHPDNHLNYYINHTSLYFACGKTTNKNPYNLYINFRSNNGAGKSYINDILIGKEITFPVRDKQPMHPRFRDKTIITDTLFVMKSGFFENISTRNLSDIDKQAVNKAMTDAYTVVSHIEKVTSSGHEYFSKFKKISEYKGITPEHGPFYDHKIIF